jgi:hypothetical protein
MDAVAVALAAGSTIKAAAKRAAVAERTVRGWLTRPAFRSRVSRIRDQAVSQAVAMLSRDMVAAAGVLKKLLRSEREDVRLRAARAVIELGIAARDHDDLLNRVEELERRLAETKP